MKKFFLTTICFISMASVLTSCTNDEDILPAEQTKIKGDSIQKGINADDLGEEEARKGKVAAQVVVL
ncbi:hypothetical protein [Flavobacterium sp.]|uniref:hypothetical protein n=1 Tax=Flavobacterium sp. TaxID=239 RepID=UPI0022BD0FF4|nr:hypothetical protein [Flavobacterium sp.]MCZ8229729.1 hypothetical protein [Flavobacterium sp.]